MSAKRVWVVGIVGLAAAAGVWNWQRDRKADAQPSVETVRVERGTVRRAVTATGVVQPQNRVEIKPPIAGRIEDVLVREGEAVKAGQVLAWMSSSERAALLDAARAKGEAELAHWRELYRAAPLLAPLDGTIISRKVEPGQTVTAADAVLVLSDRLIVQAQVDETDIGSVAVGRAAEIVVDAFPTQTVAAKVDHIGYEAVTVNNVTVYEVDVLPDMVPGFMRAGMTANVTMIAEVREGVLWLPSSAVARGREGATVRVAGGQGAGEGRSTRVETGLDNGREVEILSGLSEGDRVEMAGFRMPTGEGQLSSPFSPMGRRPR